MSKTTEPTKIVYRDSETGHFIPKREAERHPNTTEKERVRIAPPPPPAPKKK